MALSTGAVVLGRRQPIPVASLMAVAHGRPVVLDPEAKGRMEASRRVVEAAVSGGAVIYGVTTGFGHLAQVAVAPEVAALLQQNLVRSHAAGVGPILPRPIARAMVALRAHALAQGWSGVRPEVVERLIDFLNYDVVPVIPRQGSVGASGDLAPLAHIALALMGEGTVLYQGERRATPEVLGELGWSPLVLSAKEGLALTNGTQFMAAYLAFLVAFGKALLDYATRVAALTFQCLRGVSEAFHPDLLALRPHPGALVVGGWLRRELVGSQLTTAPGEVRIQDAYSLRCLPQIHGTVWDALWEAERVLAIETGSVTDNPLIFPDSGSIRSGGNFHGQPLAFWLDGLGIALSYLATSAERRTERLVNPDLSGLPAFLTESPGVSSGLMLAQYTSAALASANKVLAHPSSVDSIPTSANQEDLVSMGAFAGEKAWQILENVRRVVAVEWYVACQAAEFVGTDRLSPRSRLLYHRLRAEVPPYREGVLAEALEAAERVLGEALRSQVLSDEAGAAQLD